MFMVYSWWVMVLKIEIFRTKTAPAVNNNKLRTKNYKLFTPSPITEAKTSGSYPIVSL